MIKFIYVHSYTINSSSQRDVPPLWNWVSAGIRYGTVVNLCVP